MTDVHRIRESHATFFAVSVMVFLMASVASLSASGQEAPEAPQHLFSAAIHRPVLHAPEQIQAALQKVISPDSVCGQTITYWKPTFLYYWNISQVSVSDTGFEYTQTIKWSNGWGWRHDGAVLSFHFSDLTPVGPESIGSQFRVVLPLPNASKGSVMCVADGRQTWLVWGQEEDAKAFAAAVNWMVWQNSPEGQAKIARQKRTEQAFQQQLAGYQAATDKPKMPDEAHVHEVLAKNAIDEKNLDKGIDEYEAGLEIFPTWPEGQFNLAFLCGESGDYYCAVEHMQDYLELVPGAPNAQAAKDKLIIWKDKLGSVKSPATP